MRNIVLLIASLVLAVSCYTERMQLLVLEPAEIDLPDEIRKISLFPGTYFSGNNHIDSLDDIRLTDKSDAGQILIGYLDGIYEILSASPRFDRVIFSDSSFSKMVKDGHLYWDDLRTICTHDTTCVILLLQKAIIHDDVLYKEYQNKNSYFGDYRILNKTKWAFLKPFEEKTIKILIDSDSLLLTGLFASGEIESLLYRSCYTSGYLTGMKVAPYWQDTVRTYFKGPGRDLRESSILVQKNNWRAAGLVWNDLAYGKNRGIASKAAFNMALAWEHDDQLDQSIAWLEYADSLRSSEFIRSYRQILEKRMAKQKILDQQMQ